MAQATAYAGTQCAVLWAPETTRGTYETPTFFLGLTQATPDLRFNTNPYVAYAVGYHVPIFMKPGRGEWRWGVRFDACPFSYDFISRALRASSTTDLTGISIALGNDAWAVGIAGAVIGDLTLEGQEGGPLRVAAGGLALDASKLANGFTMDYSTLTQWTLMWYEGSVTLGTTDWSLDLRSFRIRLTNNLQPKYAFGAASYLSYGPKWIKEVEQRIVVDFDAYEALDLDTIRNFTGPIDLTVSFTDAVSGYGMTITVTRAWPATWEHPGIQVNQVGQYRYSYAATNMTVTQITPG